MNDEYKTKLISAAKYKGATDAELDEFFAFYPRSEAAAKSAGVTEQELDALCADLPLWLEANRKRDVVTPCDINVFNEKLSELITPTEEAKKAAEKYGISLCKKQEN